MIDWVTAKIPYVHTPMNGGKVFKTDAQGCIEWETNCRLSVEGSYSGKITVRSEGGDGTGQAAGIILSGNPAKFLQGHNVFGTDDLVTLVRDSVLRVFDILSLKVTDQLLDVLHTGNYRLTQVDINYMYALPTQADVRAWLRAAEFKSKTRHGRSLNDRGTIYWGRSSKRWSMKAYSKHDELSVPKHSLPAELKHTELHSFTEGKLRLEVTIKSKELDKLNLANAKNWGTDTPASIHSEYLKRLEMNTQVALSTDILNLLPNNIRSTYVNWKEGYNPKDLLSKPTYYRHRSELLKHGIDINLARDVAESSNVIPLVRILEAQPVEIPEWAYKQGLIHGCKNHTPDLKLVKSS